MGRTVRPLLADCPPGRRGLSARLVEKRDSTGRSRANNGSSAPGCRTVRAPRGPSAWAPRTVRTCRAQVGPRSRGDKSAASFLYPKPQEAFPSRSLSLSLLGDFDSSSPRTVRAHPRTLREVLHHVIRVFFRISHSLSQILSKKVIRVW
jgi:hypothetical protein